MGGSAPSALTVSKCENFYPFFIEIWFFDTQNTCYLIVMGLKNAFFMPFLWLSKWGAGLLEMMIRSDGTGLLQMVKRRGRPLTNDHLEGSSSKRRNWGFQNSWAFICFLREKYTLGEESIIFYVWSHAQSKVYNVKITKPKVKRRLRTRSPLRRYPASFSCDAGKGTKLRGRNLLSFWQLLFLCYFL